jgi:hypothetical protein
MSYKSCYLLCRNREHGEMDYEGEGNYVCSVCGLKFHDEEYDDEDSGEGLSVYDAALIWASNGKDEDYTFGYSEEELEDAL